ncbi:MAG: hypothetical protein ACXV74_00360 [Methylobacter sp.]
MIIKRTTFGQLDTAPFGQLGIAFNSLAVAWVLRIVVGVKVVRIDVGHELQGSGNSIHQASTKTEYL